MRCWGSVLAVKSRQQQQEQEQGIRVGNRGAVADAAAAEVVTLYHQTSPQHARAILESSSMRPGPRGNGGSGLYFAPDPQATTCKANHHGVILECRVRLGRVRVVNSPGKHWHSRLRQRVLRYDSVALTFLEGGLEYVVYDPARVHAIRVHSTVSTTASSLSAESSRGSFYQIGTATDPGCSSSGSSSGSQSSEGASSSSGSSSVSEDGTTSPYTPVPPHQLCSRISSHMAQGPDASSSSSSSSDGSGSSSSSDSSPCCHAGPRGASEPRPTSATVLQARSPPRGICQQQGQQQPA